MINCKLFQMTNHAFNSVYLQHVKVTRKGQILKLFDNIHKIQSKRCSVQNNKKHKHCLAFNFFFLCLHDRAIVVSRWRTSPEPMRRICSTSLSGLLRFKLFVPATSSNTNVKGEKSNNVRNPLILMRFHQFLLDSCKNSCKILYVHV